MWYRGKFELPCHNQTPIPCQIYEKKKEGNEKKCEEVCEPWHEFCTAKLKEVLQAGRDAFAWQTRQDTVEAQKSFFKQLINFFKQHIDVFEFYRTYI